MNTQTFQVNDTVQVLDGNRLGAVGTITAIKGQWHTVVLEDGTTVKGRAKQLTSYDADADLGTDDETSKQSLAKTIAKYRDGYVPTIAAGGKKSLSNGDDLALFMAGMEPAQVCQLADQLLAVPSGFHAAKYSHLNRGQQRMNAGNRIRAAAKRGDVYATFDDKGVVTALSSLLEA